MCADKADETAAARRAAEFKSALDAHGHGFQYAMVHAIGRQLANVWEVECEEMPVQVAGIETHVDFVLRSSRVGGMILVGECKRADPARSYWCFARAAQRGAKAWLDVATTTHDSTDRLFAIPVEVEVNAQTGPYHVARTVTTGEKGSGVGSNKSPIDEAVTQVLRSTSGFLNAASEQSFRHSFVGDRAIIIPCIVTTAKLFASETDLAAASHKTGELPDFEMQSLPWVWFQHAASRSLHHSVPGRWNNVAKMREYVDRGFTRTVAVVNAEAFEHFSGHLLEVFRPR